jgi:hypothetical protein
VGERFGSGEFRLEICGQQIPIGKVVVGEIRKTRSDWESFRWRYVGERIALRGLLLERCERQVRVWRVFVGEMWATGSS